MSQLDFGFGRSVALRSPADAVVGNLMILYPHRKVKDDPDHGWEIVLPFEAEHVDMLINDPELNEFLQYCGYEAHAQLTPRVGPETLHRVGSRAKLKDGFARMKIWVFLNLPV